MDKISWAAVAGPPSPENPAAAVPRHGRDPSVCAHAPDGRQERCREHEPSARRDRDPTRMIDGGARGRPAVPVLSVDAGARDRDDVAAPPVWAVADRPGTGRTRRRRARRARASWLARPQDEMRCEPADPARRFYRQAGCGYRGEKLLLATGRQVERSRPAGGDDPLGRSHCRIEELRTPEKRRGLLAREAHDGRALHAQDTGELGNGTRQVVCRVFEDAGRGDRVEGRVRERQVSIDPSTSRSASWATAVGLMRPWRETDRLRTPPSRDGRARRTGDRFPSPRRGRFHDARRATRRPPPTADAGGGPPRCVRRSACRSAPPSCRRTRERSSRHRHRQQHVPVGKARPRMPQNSRLEPEQRSSHGVHGRPSLRRDTARRGRRRSR